MDNSYIIDTFLSACAWFGLIFICFDVRARVSELSGTMQAYTLATAFKAVLKLSSLLTAPLALVYLFMLWRFYGFMVATQAWGAGGAGLIAIMIIIGLPILWLDTMLTCVKHSSYMTVSRQAKDYRQQKSRIDTSEGF